MTPDLGIEPGPRWWEASALTTAPSLHPIEVKIIVLENDPVNIRLFEAFYMRKLNKRTLNSRKECIEFAALLFWYVSLYLSFYSYTRSLVYWHLLAFSLVPRGLFYFILSFPDDAVERRKLGLLVLIFYSSSRPHWYFILLEKAMISTRAAGPAPHTCVFSWGSLSTLRFRGPDPNLKRAVGHLTMHNCKMVYCTVIVWLFRHYILQTLRGVVLISQVCPTSSILTGAVKPCFQKHPLRR